MSAAAQAKIKLYKEMEELKRKVAATERIEHQLDDAKARIKEYEDKEEEFEQWKKDFADGAKNVNHMKQEVKEKSKLILKLRSQLHAQEEEEDKLTKQIGKLKENMKIADKVRDGTMRKFRNQEKEMAKLREENRLHDNLRVAAEEELRKLKQFLDQERSFRLQDLYRHNELNKEKDELEKEKQLVEDERWDAIKEVAQQRAQSRGLKAALKVKTQVGLVSESEIQNQYLEIGELKLQNAELKRLVQEKNSEIGSWARRFGDLEGEYGRVQRRLALVAESHSDKNEMITQGRLAEETVKFLQRQGAVAVRNGGTPVTYRTETFSSRGMKRSKAGAYQPPDFASRITAADAIQRPETSESSSGGGVASGAGGPGLIQQPYYASVASATATDHLHLSATVYGDAAEGRPLSRSQQRSRERAGDGFGFDTTRGTGTGASTLSGFAPSPSSMSSSMAVPRSLSPTASSRLRISRSRSGRSQLSASASAASVGGMGSMDASEEWMGQGTLPLGEGPPLFEAGQQQAQQAKGGTSQLQGSMYLGRGLGIRKPLSGSVYEMRTSGSARNVLAQVLHNLDL